jgi:hypothetical protein
LFLWLALGALASLPLLLLLVAQLPLTFGCNVQGKAEPSGAWAVACGLGLGPIALSAIAAAGVKPFLTCHLFGKQIARLPLSRWVRRRARVAATQAEPKPEHEAETETRLTRFEHGFAAWFRSLDPLEIVLACWENERLFRVRSLVLELDYSFRDVALTGRILAGLYMLSAVLPDVCEIHQTPHWESEDRLSLGADAQFKLWPGRLLLSIGRFVLKHRSEARERARLAKQTTHPT